MKITKGLIAYWQGPKGKDQAITRTRTTTRTIDGANGVKSAAMVVLAVGLEAVDRRRDRDVEPACADKPTPDETMKRTMGIEAEVGGQRTEVGRRRTEDWRQEAEGSCFGGSFGTGGNREGDEVEIGDAFAFSIVTNDSGTKAYGRIS